MPPASEVEPWLARMDEARIYSNFGPLVRELEALFARHLNVAADRVVSVANATLGLVGAVSVTTASDWLIPDFTFPATAHAVLGAGRRLHFGDVHLEDWQLDVSTAVDALEVGTLGVMPVMPFGAPVNLSPWARFTHVVLDAAASLGADDLDLSGLPSGWSVVFSLHATKVLPAGEGGLVVFGSPDQARIFRAWTNFGFAGTRLSSVVGTNAKMSEITAAYGLASLAGWSDERAAWAKRLGYANSITRDLGLSTPVQGYTGVHPYWIAQFANGDLRKLAESELAAAGIETRSWWPVPLHEMPAFAGVRTDGPAGNARALAETVIGLPMFRELTLAEIDQVGNVLQRVPLG